MDADEFRRAGKEVIDFIADNLESMRSRRPMPEVEPGYLGALIPDHAPEESDTWGKLFKDFKQFIMPGVGHWQHPNFHAYFPGQVSYPGILGELLMAGLGTVEISWASSPACTELEVIMMNWLGKSINLPGEFLFGSRGNGGGFIQGTASEALLVAMLSARAREILKMKQNNPEMDDAVCMSRFVAYTSDQAHSFVEKTCLIACIKMRALTTDDKESLRGQTLLDAIQKDRAQGIIPIFLCATLGTTSSCAFDNISELGEICKQEGIWMHIDAAYAGSAFICPEFRPLLNGVENAESFNFNPHKWLQVNFDCSAMWVKDSTLMSEAFNVNPVYLQHEHQGKMPDYRHWDIPLGRRFRSLKLWFVLRMFGLKKLQECIRKDVRLAHVFKEFVKSDPRFELFGQVVMGLVCFRLRRRSNEDSATLLKAINTDGRIHIVPSVVKGTYFLRFAVCASRTDINDVQRAWGVIREITDKIYPHTSLYD